MKDHDSDPSDQRRAHLLKYPVANGSSEAIIDPYNRRIKLYGLTPGDFANVNLACLLPAEAGLKEVDYSKVIVYSAEGYDDEWQLMGFHKEGIISGFFPGHIDGHIWTLYLESARRENHDSDQHDRIVESALKKATDIPVVPAGYDCEVAGLEDAEEVAVLLQMSFRDYPVPLDTESIRKRILARDHFFMMMRDSSGDLAAVAAAEIDFKRESAELTDCASRMNRRGQGLMTYLLWRIEQDMVGNFGISDLYSLVRAGEVDMNIIFGKLCYQYSGRLINNCRMPHGWESVNIWCKTARKGSIGDRVDKVSFSKINPRRSQVGRGRRIY